MESDPSQPSLPTEKNGSDALPSAIRYGGFWKRVLATILDAAIIYPLVLASVLLVFNRNHMIDRYSPIEQGAYKGFLRFLLYLFLLLYFALWESGQHQGTPGKLIVGIRVVDRTGHRLSFGRALGRSAAKSLSSILFAGFVLAAFTLRKQGLHDLIAGTLVVTKRKVAGKA